MEVFFAVATACVVLGFGAWALLALRQVVALGRRTSER
jgi:hypothetical protein